MTHNITKLITGHDLIQPKPIDAPLEFYLSPGDAELVAKCAAAVDALRQKNAVESLKSAARAALGGEA